MADKLERTTEALRVSMEINEELKRRVLELERKEKRQSNKETKQNKDALGKARRIKNRDPVQERENRNAFQEMKDDAPNRDDGSDAPDRDNGSDAREVCIFTLFSVFCSQKNHEQSAKVEQS